jgi:hypothetical protein
VLAGAADVLPVANTFPDNPPKIMILQVFALLAKTNS